MIAPLAAVLCCSGYVPFLAKNGTALEDGAVAPANRDCPVVVFHGKSDDVVPWAGFAQPRFEALQRLLADGAMTYCVDYGTKHFMADGFLTHMREYLPQQLASVRCTEEDGR